MLISFSNLSLNHFFAPLILFTSCILCLRNQSLATQVRKQLHASRTEGKPVEGFNFSTKTLLTKYLEVCKRSFYLGHLEKENRVLKITHKFLKLFIVRVREKRFFH